MTERLTRIVEAVKRRPWLIVAVVLAVVAIGFVSGILGAEIDRDLHANAFVADDIVVNNTLGVTGLTTATGGLTVPGALKVTGLITSTAVGTQNDLVLTGGAVNVLRWNGASAITFTGFKCSTGANCAASDDGTILIIDNVTANIVANIATLTGSSANNQVAVSDGLGTIQFNSTGGASALLKYDGTTLKWRVIAHGGVQIGALSLGTTLSCSSASGCQLSSAAASATVPTLIPNRAATGAGVCSDAADDVSICTASTERFRVDTNGNLTLFKDMFSDNAGGYKLGRATGTSTNPVFFNNRSATTTGIGGISGEVATINAGATSLRIAGTAPSANHGTVTAGSLDISGTVTGVGAFTSTTLTLGTTTYTRCDCTAGPTAHGVVGEYMEVAQSATAPVISCFASTTSIAANCDDLVYLCSCR